MADGGTVCPDVQRFDGYRPTSEGRWRGSVVVGQVLCAVFSESIELGSMVEQDEEPAVSWDSTSPLELFFES